MSGENENANEGFDARMMKAIMEEGGDEFFDSSEDGTGDDDGQLSGGQGSATTGKGAASGAEGGTPEKAEEIDWENFDFEAINPEKLPKELRAHFNKMLGAHTRRMEKLANVEKKAELWDFVTENPQFFFDKFGGGGGKKTDDVVDDRQAELEKKVINELGLPEDNELSTPIKKLATLMLKAFGNLQKERVATSENEVAKGVKSYLDANPEIKKDKELYLKMDELGTENPNLYRNMKRLRTLAEIELGREVKKESSSDPTPKDLQSFMLNFYKEMQKAKKNKTTRPTTSGGGAAPTNKKYKNVKEAMEAAIDQLKGA